MKWFRILSFVAVFCVGALVMSQEASEETPTPPKKLTVSEFLQKFKENPKSVIDLLPTKDYSRAEALEDFKTELGEVWTWLQVNAHTASNWTREKIVAYNDDLDGTVELPEEGRRPWKGNDLPEDLLGTDDYVKRLADLPTEGQANEVPWSSDYWPLKSGAVAARYMDREGSEQRFNSWLDFFNSFQQPREFLNLKRPIATSSTVDFYSPAEKYDILVGDKNFTLTNGLKLVGADYANPKWGKNEHGEDIVVSVEKEVEHWMGICHGWAGAAYKISRPTKAIEVTGVNGDKVTFHEDDLKGLAVQKWANSRSESRFVGGRCNVKDTEVEKDEETGAVIDDDCFDTNPGTWHLIATNKLSKGESFVVDATYDYEVWNQPAVSYRLVYFNPKTMEAAENLKDATVPYGFEGDKFHSLREKNWKRANTESGKRFRPAAIVGVAMAFSYVVETQPKHGTSRENAIVTAQYYYDLELDKKGNIVGGEWYQNKHPDFIWDPSSDFGVWPENAIDQYLSQLNKTKENQYKYDGSIESLKRVLSLGVETDDGKTLNVAELSSLPRSQKNPYGDQSPLATVLEYLLSTASK